MVLRISANHDNVKNGHVKKIVDAALFLNNESEWHDIHFKVNYSLKKKKNKQQEHWEWYLKKAN